MTGSGNASCCCDPYQMPIRHEAAAICTPGLEALCEEELRSIGIKPKSGGSGVVEFRCNNRQLYAANLWLRTASRILIRVASFKATDFQHLQDRADEVDWKRWIPSDHRAEFRVTCLKSKLYHTDAIAQRLHQVVGPPSIGEPTQPFVIRIDRDIVTVSVDAGGMPLNHRGWRTEIGVAPIRPTMAAGMLMASGWTGESPLADPFCGCGTIAIEAALIAKGLPPGGKRSFAFQSWPEFEPGAWASVNAGATGKETSITVEAYDRDAGAVASTMANAKRAGVADIMEIREAVVSDLKPRSGAGLICTNPPYGKRVGDGDLTSLYQRFGTVARENRPEWAMTVVTPDRRLAANTDRRLAPLVGFGHGGLKVTVLSRQGGKSTSGEDQSD